MDQRRIIRGSGEDKCDGPIVYWMSRDQRADDNWCLRHAFDVATLSGRDLHVVFCLSDDVPYATPAHYAFMLGGLKEVAEGLGKLRIPFHMLRGNPGEEVGRFAKRIDAGLVITEANPLRHARSWVERLISGRSVGVRIVDSHNIVPVTLASEKREYAAFTIRPKLNRLLGEFLEPPSQMQARAGAAIEGPNGADEIEAELKRMGKSGSFAWQVPGGRAARARLAKFLDEALEEYPLSNDPNANAQSGLSAYIHFGQISAQRVVIEAMLRGGKGSDDFVEQAFIRRELAENFCHYCADYDSLDCLPEWARRTLDRHRPDEREYDYDYEALKGAGTHDRLWNAAQRQMVERGHMPGYLRMYWAKKVLEWSRSPEEAFYKAIRLNDTFSLDGRDPNGYAGIAWSIGGLHDRPWEERPIFGTIRYMSYGGAARKFDVRKYIEGVEAGLDQQ